MPRVILLTTDFSELSRRAFPHAVRLSRAMGLPIRLLNVFDTLASFDPLVPVPGSWQARIEDAALQHLTREAQPLRDAGAPVEVRFRLGLPALEILSDIEDEVGAVVMATHGHGGIRRLLLGSTSSKVLRRSPVPMLVVGPEAPDRDVTNILLPVDFSEVATGALPEAMALARGYSARVELYHAVVPQYSPLVVTGLGAEAGALEESHADRRVRTDASLAKLAESAAGFGVEVSTVVEEGSHAAESICSRAETSGAGLVIMPAHGTRGFSRLLLGSVTEEVAHRCRRPVLVLKPPRLGREGGGAGGHA